MKNTPRASSNAVAELAMALLFSCARNISIAGHTMRENKWEKKAYSKGFELSGKTMGVIGYGRIGQLVGAKGQALGMNVLSVVHRNKPEGCECETMHFVTMDELLSQSDIIVLCAPSGDKPLVDAESLAKMKDGVVIINVSRGCQRGRGRPAGRSELRQGQGRRSGRVAEREGSQLGPGLSTRLSPARPTSAQAPKRLRNASARNWWTLSSTSADQHSRSNAPPVFTGGAFFCAVFPIFSFSVNCSYIFIIF